MITLSFILTMFSALVVLNLILFGTVKLLSNVMD